MWHSTCYHGSSDFNSKDVGLGDYRFGIPTNKDQDNDKDVIPSDV